jgi:hypothetical protein
MDTNKVYYSVNGLRKEAKGEQLDYILQTQATVQNEVSLIEAETTAKAEAKESGMAKLRKLGLTDDEIAGLIS